MNKTLLTLLDILRRNGSLTKQELMERTSLSLSSINNYLAELNQMKLLSTEQHQTNTIGRKPNTLAVKDDVLYMAGIDIGGWSIRVLITDINGNIVEKELFPSHLHKGPEAVFQQIGDVFSSLLEKTGITNRSIAGTGISMSGFLDTSNMTCRKMPFFTNWNNTSISEMVSRFLPLPPNSFIIFEDSARTMTLAELRFGLGKTLETFFVINIGAGLGGGLVLNKQVFWGENGFATEIGHIRVTNENKVCICGKQGCLETYASSWSLRRQVETDLKGGVITDVDLSITDTSRKLVDATPIYRACAAGDRYANTLVTQMCRYLSEITSIISQLINPDTIILCGGVVREIEDIIVRHLQNFHEHSFGRETAFVVSPLGEYSSALGAATLALDTMFEKGSVIPFIAS